MRVTDIIKAQQGKAVSVEIEPPTLGKGIGSLWEVLDELVELKVAYIDVTYHPEKISGHHIVNGVDVPIAQQKKPGTEGVVGAITQRYPDIQCVPHVICTGFSKYETEAFLVTLSYLGVENVLALRGDPPKGPDNEYLDFEAAPLGNAYANDLIEQLVNLREAQYVGAKKGVPIDFCIGAACYPEGYKNQEPEKDWETLQCKVDAGADFFVTQMFFDASHYEQFREEAEKRGIDKPIIPGIMPLFKKHYIEILPQFFDCSIPKTLRERMEMHPEELRQIGIDWCIHQAQELREKGAPSLHFYANRGAPVAEVIRSL